MVQAVIRGLGLDKTYKSSGLEHLEIVVDKQKAAGLPFVEGVNVPIKLFIGNRVFNGMLKATVDNSVVWISQKLFEGDKRTTLADVCSESGLAKNQTVNLAVDGTDVVLTTE